LESVEVEKALSKVDLFRGLSEKERASLGDQCTLLEFDKKKPIFREGDAAETIWFILSGWVRIVKRSPQGRLVTVFIVTPQESILGVSTLGATTYSATAIPATHVEAIGIPKDVFVDFLNHYPVFAKSIIDICCQRIREMVLSYTIAYDNVEQRITHVILRLSRSFGNTLPFTHKEISEMGGTALETSIRVISKMRQKGWLSVQRGQISILELAELEKTLAGYLS